MPVSRSPTISCVMFVSLLLTAVTHGGDHRRQWRRLIYPFDPGVPRAANPNCPTTPRPSKQPSRFRDGIHPKRFAAPWTDEFLMASEPCHAVRDRAGLRT